MELDPGQDLRQQHGINLADLSGSDYLRVESDAGCLVTALCHLLAADAKAAKVHRDDLARSLTGECLDSALEALWGAAKVFFPPKRWSALQLNFGQLQAQHQQMGQALAMLNQPNMPPFLVETLTTAILQGLAASVSANSKAAGSATGPDASLPSAASDSPG